MSYELIVDVKESGVRLALLKEKKLIELHEEKTGSKHWNVGDIYVGKVKKVAPSLRAVFVDVGYEKDGFLHYLDLGPRFKSMHKFFQGTARGKQKSPKLNYFKMESDIPKDGKIENTISSSQHVLVQVAKEPISAKGPRLSSEITLAGRYIVLVPFSNKISVSQKIKDADEKTRLRKLIDSIRPKNFGVIIRTVAENRKVAELDADLRDLVGKWDKLHHALKQAKPPHRVLGELNKTSSLLRDLLSAEFTNIHVNDERMTEEISEFVSNIAPGKEKIVKHYKRRIGIFQHFGINKQIKASFGKKVMMPSGAYLIIEHTEAMHVVDINSGSKKPTEANQERNALETNLEAAQELARLLRLRDMGGIIVIDFIDMHQRSNNRKLFEQFKDSMKGDRAKHSISPPSKFGVVELTRQRVRPETEIKTKEQCPACMGSGDIQASILIIDEIQNSLKSLLEKGSQSKVELQVHPFIEAYLKHGLKSIQRQWFMNHKKWVKIQGLTDFNFLEYKFVDRKGEPITA